MYMQLGTLRFRKSNAPVADSFDNQWKYAQHDPIEGYPILQAIGQELADRTMSLVLHADDLDPQLAYQQLYKMARAMKSYPLVHGFGKYEGDYVIISLRVVRQTAFEDGYPMQLDIEMTLKEVVKSAPIKAKEPTKKKKKAKPYKKKAKASQGEYIDSWRYHKTK